MEDYLITHIGNGKFQVKLEDGKIIEAGHNLCGMIRYTYFEDYNLPKIGWNITRKQLYEDYLPKLHKDIVSGKIKLNQINNYGLN